MDCWVGNSPLCEQFPRLFSISIQKEALVCDLRVRTEDGERWNWRWRRNLFAWEHDLLRQLVEMVPLEPLTMDKDVWWWGLEEDGAFTVKSAYLFLDRIFPPVYMFDTYQLKVMNNIWRSAAPSKVIAFSWKLLRNRIPTKVNLAARGIQVAGGSVHCVHCVGNLEEVQHLFMFCDFACRVWSEICKWLGFLYVMPPNLFIFFDSFVGAAARKKAAAGYSLIWHTTIWSIWRSRNDVSFANGALDLSKVIDDIKVQSWRWGMSRRVMSTCLFYEWCCEPGICLS
jgi:hypothetical protein